MKKAGTAIAALFMAGMLLLSGCQAEPSGICVAKEAVHFSTQTELADYIQQEEQYTQKVYYRPQNIPERLDFDEILAQYSYIGFYYGKEGQENWMILEWTWADDGQERLEQSIRKEELAQLGDSRYYYKAVSYDGGKSVYRYQIEWVQDGYRFTENISPDCVEEDGKLNPSLIEWYAQVEKVVLSTQEDG